MKHEPENEKLGEISGDSTIPYKGIFEKVFLNKKENKKEMEKKRKIFRYCVKCLLKKPVTEFKRIVMNKRKFSDFCNNCRNFNLGVK